MGANPQYTESLRRLMEMLGQLPGVGSRSAERMAFHLLKNSREEALALADAIRAVKDQVRHCSICFNLTEADPCNICTDPSRDHSVICVVEQPKDLLQLESTGIYKGVYHVLLGRIAPLENIHPGDLTIPQLLERIKPPDDEGPWLNERAPLTAHRRQPSKKSSWPRTPRWKATAPPSTCKKNSPPWLRKWRSRGWRGDCRRGRRLSIRTRRYWPMR